MPLAVEDYCTIGHTILGLLITPIVLSNPSLLPPALVADVPGGGEAEEISPLQPECGTTESELQREWPTQQKHLLAGGEVLLYSSKQPR